MNWIEKKSGMFWIEVEFMFLLPFIYRIEKNVTKD